MSTSYYHATPIEFAPGDIIVPSDELGFTPFARLYEQHGENWNGEGRGAFVYLCTDLDEIRKALSYGQPHGCYPVPVEEQRRRIFEVEPIGECGTAEDLCVPFHHAEIQIEEIDDDGQPIYGWDDDGDPILDPEEHPDYIPERFDPWERVCRRARVIREITA